MAVLTMRDRHSAVLTRGQVPVGYSREADKEQYGQEDSRHRAILTRLQTAVLTRAQMSSKIPKKKLHAHWSAVRGRVVKTVLPKCRIRT